MSGSKEKGSKKKAKQATGRRAAAKPRKAKAKKKIVGPSSPAKRPPRSEAFRDQLGSMETFLDEALREAGGGDEIAADDGPLLRAAEGFLDAYARLGRTLEESSVADVLSSVGDRMRGDSSDFGYDAELEKALHPLLGFLYQRWWRVEAVGVDLIPREGPVVLVANHSGSVFAYDGAMLRMALLEHHPTKRTVRPLLDASVTDLPVLGDVMARCGGVEATPDNADALLDREEVIACFPEAGGGFSRSFRHRYELGVFEDATFLRAAVRAGAPVLPVAVIGAEEVHPALGRLDGLARRLGMPTLPLTPTFPWLGVGGLLPLPSRWRIEVGRPIRGLDRLNAEALDDPRHCAKVVKRVRGRVQALVDGAVQRRGRAFL